MSVQVRHIAIDVLLDGDAISGRADDGTGRPKAFQGWLELLMALDGRITVPVDRTFPLSEAAAAHAYMDERRHVGKIVLVAA